MMRYGTSPERAESFPFHDQVSSAYARSAPEADVTDQARDLVLLGLYRVAYRSVNATSRELKTGLNIYRIIDFEPV